MFDHSKLLGRIVEKFGNRGLFAEAAGMTAGQMYSRLQGTTEFSDKEIYNVAKALEIPPADIPDYFFTLKVR